MISNYRRMLMQAIDFGCILLALIVCEFCTLPPELNVFKDYTGACIFTFFFYLLFFYIKLNLTCTRKQSKIRIRMKWNTVAILFIRRQVMK